MPILRDAEQNGNATYDDLPGPEARLAPTTFFFGDYKINENETVEISGTF